MHNSLLGEKHHLLTMEVMTDMEVEMKLQASKLKQIMKDISVNKRFCYERLIKLDSISRLHMTSPIVLPLLNLPVGRPFL